MENESKTIKSNYLKYMKNLNVPKYSEKNKGELSKKETNLDNTILGSIHDKLYNFSNKNYNNPILGSYARFSDGLSNLYEVFQGGLGLVPGIGDAADVASLGNDLNNKNYGNAALTASLMWLPGSVSKIKLGFNYAKDLKSVEKLYDLISKNLKNTEWYETLVKSYGRNYADAVAKNMSKNPDSLLNFIFKKDPDNIIIPEAETLQFHKGRDLMDRTSGSLDEGKGLITGSAAIMNEGSIQRPSAAFHDIDMYILAPGLKSEAELVPKVTDDLDLSILIDKNKLRKLPMFQEILPGMATIKRRGVPEEGVTNLFRFRPYKDEDLLKGLGLVRGNYKGYSLDFFPTFVQIPKSSNGIRKGLVSSDVPMQFKYAWRRDKDLKDINTFKKWGADNPIIDINTGRTQFSPLSFESGILTNEGLPVISDIETYPGSNKFVPAIMNWKGQFRNPLSNDLDSDLFIYKNGGIVNKNKKLVNKQVKVFYQGKSVGYITLPKNITDDQAMGRKPIYSDSKYNYYMNGDGTVMKKLKLK